MRSLVFALPGLLLALLSESDASARPAPVIVTVDAAVPVRVQIALAPQGTIPCDSSDNAMVFDGTIDPDRGLALQIEEGPLCVRHAYDNFPDGGDWSSSQLWIRRYASPLRIRLQARAPQD
ncbi:MAG: hypothetical protein ACLQVI_10480 [Polyangiaceae bacterium]